LAVVAYGGFDLITIKRQIIILRTFIAGKIISYGILQKNAVITKTL